MESRFWAYNADDNGGKKPYGKNTVCIVDEDQGGVIAYVGGWENAHDILRALNQANGI